MRVYVAAPFARRSEVREVHKRLRALGIEPTSSWANAPDGIADAPTPEEAKVAIRQNDADLKSSDAVLVMGYPGEGGEQFAEARLGILLGKPVIWTGRRILSSFRPGAVYLSTLDLALSALRGLAIERAR
jgi:hypothetical protein